MICLTTSRFPTGTIANCSDFLLGSMQNSSMAIILAIETVLQARRFHYRIHLSETSWTVQMLMAAQLSAVSNRYPAWS